MMRALFACDIPRNASIDATVTFDHNALGCVVSSRCRIGPGTHLYHHVTLGADASGGYPSLGTNVTICTGAVVIGAVHVGDNAIVGANSVVTKDVPAGAIVAGNPARQIGTTELASACPRG
jgi:serine O-acetyltransferase